MAAKKKQIKKIVKSSTKKAKKAAKKTVKKVARKAVKKVAKKTKKAVKKSKKVATASKVKKKAKKAVVKKKLAKKTSQSVAKGKVKKASAKSIVKKSVPAPKQAVVEAEKPVKLSLFVQKQRQRLLDLLDELDASTSGMAKDTLKSGPEGSEANGSGQHQGDAGSDAYDRDLALNILSKEQDALYEVEEALRRVNRGVYGICEISQKRIPNERLEAIPFCRLTVSCQERWEDKFGKTRFRREDEPGYMGSL